ncbi:Ig-like domain-containing protein [Vibrio nereis]|nr:NEW3 domain-containing protein [Vibrio nereis]
MFNTSAVSQDAIFTHEHPAEQNNSQSKSGLGIASEKRQSALDNTKALTKALAHYLSAKDKSKANYLNQMVSLVKERQSLLSELAQADPASVSSVVMTKKQRNEMPEEVQALLEQKQELEGELEVFYEDYEDHSKSRLRHVLKTANGRIELNMAQDVKNKAFKTGSKVRARVWKFKSTTESPDSLLVTNEKDGLTILAQDSTETSPTSAVSTSSLSNTKGEQRTLVLLVNFQDNVQQPWSIDEVKSMVFGTVNQFVKENSSGQTWLNGDVHGYNTLPMDSTTCDSSSIDRYARQYAEEDGIDLSNYSRLIYVFPKVASCGWTGKGTLGGTQSRAWINGALTLNTIGHELGHNFGLHHAEKLDCGDDVIGDNCVSVTYGDTLDIMGAAGVKGHYGAYNKELLGWISRSESEIVVADSDGSYQLAPYESTAVGTLKSLKVRRGTDSVTGEPSWYYIEYRQPIGFDSFLEGKDGITNGVVFRVASEANTKGSQLLDMTPSSSWVDMDDAALPVGSSYTDPEAGVTITTEWANSTGASVHVSFSAQTCAQSNPTVTLAPNTVVSGVAGSTVSYNVTVKNNDGNGCPASGFNVSANVPAGWTASNATLSLAPGISGTTTVSITSSEMAADGAYDIAIQAVNGADSRYLNQVTANYTVEAPMEVCLLANPVLALTANQSGEVAPGTTVSYTATLTSQDSETCDAAVVDVIANVPDGWTADSNTVTLEPGGKASVKLNVTSSIDASEGVYPVNVNAFNTADISYRSSAEERYSVAATELVCNSVAPRMAISSTSGEVAAGTSVAYNVTVTNQDKSDCAATTFNVFAELPAGWSATNSNVTLNPGQSATLWLNVTSATTAPEGMYNVIIKAQNTEQTNLISSGTATYVVASAVNTSPVAVNDAITLSSKNAMLINVLANDSDPEGDTLSIVSVTQGAKGSVQITADGQLLYTPAKSFKNSDTFTYSISDGDKTATATVSISMSGSESGGGNKGKGKK